MTFILSNSYVGDWFVLYQLSKNVDSYFFRMFITELEKSLKENQPPQISAPEQPSQVFSSNQPSRLGSLDIGRKKAKRKHRNKSSNKRGSTALVLHPHQSAVSFQDDSSDSSVPKIKVDEASAPTDEEYKVEDV